MLGNLAVQGAQSPVFPVLSWSLTKFHLFVFWDKFILFIRPWHLLALLWDLMGLCINKVVNLDNLAHNLWVDSWWLSFDGTLSACIH